ncbi:unnamed protein product [Spirodela intermedia]|uniref:Uncharacterized protein n=1 Tax=Spirodela intermedia TaxID=51605 RepID=A0A7I8J0U2_SPIIN|nr:unnamed protein product [Spirodela intermedia]CAA6662930.1 unnamed protein product [Spirodela intermedia]
MTREGARSGVPAGHGRASREWNVTAVQGAAHRVVRGAMLSAVGPVAVRERFFPTLDEFIRSHLCEWGAGGAIVDVQEKAREMVFSLALRLIAGIETGETAAELKAEFFKLLRGTLSLAVALPGSAYRRGLQARNRITRFLRALIEERRSSDILDLLLREEEEGEQEQEHHQTRPKLTEDQMIDLLIAIMVAGFDNVYATAMMAIKYLYDHPSALQELRHSEIRRRKSSPDEALTWGTTRRMASLVILETMRLATHSQRLMRKTTDDIPIMGSWSPRGGKIYVHTREANYDSSAFIQDRNLEKHQYFMLFGCGGRLCPGKELSMVQLSLFLHHFLIKYRWEEAGGDEIVYFPRVEAPRGLHMRLWTN